MNCFNDNSKEVRDQFECILTIYFFSLERLMCEWEEGRDIGDEHEKLCGLRIQEELAKRDVHGLYECLKERR